MYHLLWLYTGYSCCSCCGCSNSWVVRTDLLVVRTEEFVVRIPRFFTGRILYFFVFVLVRTEEFVKFRGSLAEVLWCFFLFFLCISLTRDVTLVTRFLEGHHGRPSGRIFSNQGFSETRTT